MSWQKNEPNAAKRKTLVIIAAAGVPCDPGLDFMAAGAVFVVGVNAPKADLATGTMTNIRRPLALADVAFTAATTDVLTSVAHGMRTGDGPIRVTTTTTLPGGLAAATDYYVIKIDADTFYLATSLANAYAGTRVDITDTGTGTHTLDRTGVGTERGIPGHFEYAASQTELDHDRPVTEIIVDGTVGGIDFFRENADGAHQHVEMTPELASFWDVVAEGGYTHGQLHIFIARCLLARLIITGTTHTIRTLDDTVDSHHATLTAAGRDPVVVDNAP